jgi:HK97 family phage major capsid protein
VPPEYIQQLVLLRRATAPLLDRVFQVPVNSSLVYVPQQTGVSTVGWTAENATKPSTDEVLGQLSVNIFTLAGIAKVSNQLLEDSSPAVDGVVRQDVLRGLNIEMDRSIINGSGTGQPTGILNTSGVGSVTSTGTTSHPEYLLNDIITAVAQVQQNYFGQPDAIVMSPRTWGVLMTSKDTTGRFLMMPLTAGAQDYVLPGVTVPTGATADNQGITGGMVFSFAGIPIIVDANMPVNLSGTNSAIIVGNFKEAWWLKRDDIRLDVSSEAGTSWETNQTWFRGELRMGFTASRLPKAFSVINTVVL